MKIIDRPLKLHIRNNFSSPERSAMAPDSFMWSPIDNMYSVTDMSGKMSLVRGGNNHVQDA
jgi:hypothetical protein